MALLAAALATAALHAQGAVGAEEAVTAALANDESLKQAAISLAAKRRAVELAWSDLLPSLSVGAGLAGSKALPANLLTDGLSAKGSLSAALSLSPAMRDARGLDELAYEAQLLSYEAARGGVELSARKAVYAILLDQEKLKNAEASVARSEAGLRQTEAKYKAGLAPELDLLTAQVSLGTSKPAVDACRTALEADLDSLRSLMGLKPDEAIEAKGSLELAEATLDALLAEAAAAGKESSAVALARKSLETAKASKAYAERSSFLPSLSLSLAAVPSIALESGASPSLSGSASAMLSFPVGNLLKGSSARQGIAAAQDAIDLAAGSLRSAQETSRLAMKAAERSVASCRRSLATQSLTVDLASRAYDATKTAYDKGYATLEALENAEDKLESAKLSALSKSYELILAALSLEYEAGLPLDTMGRK